jgi:phosphoribosyl 1,2-cyclic phosphodiesterase
MSLFITSLNSGSNGNCYYIGNHKEAVLIDAGISCRETEKRMNRIGLSFSKVKAIFVSHEHSDHITGIPGISKKYQIPVYFTEPTYSSSNIPVEENLLRYFQGGQSISIGSLNIKAFTKFHDACDPHSFMVTGNHVNIGIFTDIGHVCQSLVEHFHQCHAAFLEANYCEDMLANGSYPVYLKKRISGKHGHLSNIQALELFIKHRPAHFSHLILAHLSKNNNDPMLVERLFREKAGKTKISVASRYQETEVYEIPYSPVIIPPKAISLQQLSLF